MGKSLEQSETSNNWSDPIVRLRGLPFSCSNEELLSFFDGMFYRFVLFFFALFFILISLGAIKI
jgi:hypothetical protein